jgi:hypothetical protein
MNASTSFHSEPHDSFSCLINEMECMFENQHTNETDPFELNYDISIIENDFSNESILSSESSNDEYHNLDHLHDIDVTSHDELNHTDMVSRNLMDEFDQNHESETIQSDGFYPVIHNEPNGENGNEISHFYHHEISDDEDDYDNDSFSDNDSFPDNEMYYHNKDGFNEIDMDEYDGLYLLSFHYLRHGCEIKKIAYCNDGCYTFLSMAEELSNSYAMNYLGIYYECAKNEFHKAAYYYDCAIQRGNSSAMYNLANMYSHLHDFDKMSMYFEMAVEYGEIDAIDKLCENYYKTIHGIHSEKFIQYFIIAIETIPNLYILGDYYFINSIIESNILELYDKIGKPRNNIAKENIDILNQIDDLLVYNNKVRLFTNLNNICECAICFDTNLNINIHCGHIFCTDCYKKVYKKNCPLCRMMPPTYNTNHVKT